MIKFQYYHGDIKKSNPIGFVSLETFVDSHLNPKANLLSVFKAIDEASKAGDKKLKAELKMNNLYSFTISAQFNGRRRYVDIREFNPLAQLDFDGLEEEEAIKFRDFVFEHYPQIVVAYLSPSRKGVKALIRIPKISLDKGIDSGIAEYKDYYRAIHDEFTNYNGFDNSPSNLVLPLFISHDRSLCYRHFDTAQVWTHKLLVKEELSEKFPLPYKPYKKLKSNDKNELRAIRTLRKYISGINSSPGHTQLRSACIIFGTRVGAGYFDRFDGLREVEDLVKQNRYLSKGLSGYLTTATWAYNEGIKTPKYYD
tara:strand:- start:7167 stop:8099 length:933 start_codon:yes stop_codon:yes gene_type:complete